MKMDGTMLKRIIAMALTLVLVFTSSDFVPGIASAIAEGEPAAQEQSAPALPESEASAVLEDAETEQEGEAPGAEEPVHEEGEQPEEAAPAVEEPVTEETEQPEEAAPAAEQPATEEEEPAQQEEALAGEETDKEETDKTEETEPEETPAAQEGEEQPRSAAGLFVLPEGTEEGNPESEEAPGEAQGALEIQVGDYIITAFGNLPEGAEIQAVEIPAETAEQLSGKKPLFAYDIRIIVDGKVWQPEENGTDVQISVKDLSGSLDGKNIDILHVKTDFLDDEGNLSEEAAEDAVQGVADGIVETERIDTDTSNGDVSFGMSSFSGVIGNVMSTLQAMFKNAMQSRAADSKKIQLNLSKNTTYQGNVEFDGGKYDDIGDDFEVELIAEDAGDDYLQADGTTKVEGNITIKGINVRVIGVSIAAGKTIKMEDSSLEYYGTKKMTR